MSLHFRHSATAVAARAAAAVLRVPPPLPPSRWAAANLVVPDGPRNGEPWSADLTPYVVEPLDMFGPDSPVNEIAFRKSAQTGFTTLAIAAIGHSIDRDPCRMMIIQPTDAALADFNRDKLQPAIEQSKVLRAKVAAQTSRSATGSTTYSKRYPGGALTLAIATSAADLRSKTIKKLIRDEIDQYPDDLDGQGDPLEISDGRLMSFLASGDWKKLDISTPTIKGASKIDARFEAGDQRFWHVPCPHCRQPDGAPSEFVFEWGENFRYARTYPHGAHYVAPCCGSIIEASEKNGLVRRGRWVATRPEPGRFPSYHFDALSSPFVPWDEIAKAYVSAGDDPAKLKTFWNLWLGLPYEMKGDAPDHELLYARREDYPRGIVPPGGIILVGAADVQMRGIWWEITAYGPRRESWTVDAGYIDGDTSTHDGEAFVKLREQVLDGPWRDAWDRPRSLDAFGIDTGFRTHAVYAWVRASQRLNRVGRDVVLALKGDDGWGKPPLSLPTLVDIDMGGRKVKKGVRLWRVGTWPLKGSLYEDLHRVRGAEGVPEGYCHFGSWQDMSYFRQLTAEYLTDETIRGRRVRTWKLRASERDNHLLDCRVYILALLEHLGLARMTTNDWAQLAAERGVPTDTVPPLLEAASAPAAGFRQSPPAAPAEASPVASLSAQPAAARPQQDDWLGGRGDFWDER